jgi:MFS transporter, UMF1 family
MSDPAPPSTRGRIFAWTLFDFANTAFSVIIVTVIFPRYFINHVSGGHSWLWGLAVSLSMILAAMLSPPLGAAADFSHRKKTFLLFFTAVSILCTALLYFVGEEMVITGIALFVLANVGFEGGLVFYDAFLPRLTSKASYGRVSGYGFAMGYVGALAVLLIVNMILPESSSPDYLHAIRMSFMIAAGFFLVFSLPLFLAVPEPSSGKPQRYTFREGFRNAGKTFKSLFITKEYPNIARFLIAFFMYNDGILTVIAFAAIFAEKILHMSDHDIIVFFTIVQTSAIIGSFLFGIITDKIGPKRTITITLTIWIAISLGSFFVASVGAFYVVAMGAGIAIGSSQSASRSLMALLTPPEREAEFFGFYDGLCGKASAVVGPVIFGLIADFTNERVASLSISLFFIAGLIIIQKVREPEMKRSTPVPR